MWSVQLQTFKKHSYVTFCASTQPASQSGTGNRVLDTVFRFVNAPLFRSPPRTRKQHTLFSAVQKKTCGLSL